ncbi:MAG: nitroreductase family protein [Oscillospiraceae bacterium]
MELSEAISARRSIRKYREGEVSEEVLRQLVEAGIKAPSWKNSQTARFYVTASAESTNAFRECLAEFNQNNTRNAAAYIVSTVLNGRSGFDREGNYSTHLKDGWQFFDNGLAVENICLKACELGLGTLIMGIYDEKKVRAFFNVPETEIVAAVVAVGHADISPEMPKRKSVDDVAHFVK